MDHIKSLTITRLGRSNGAIGQNRTDNIRITGAGIYH